MDTGQVIVAVITLIAVIVVVRAARVMNRRDERRVAAHRLAELSVNAADALREAREMRSLTRDNPEAVKMYRVATKYYLIARADRDAALQEYMKVRARDRKQKREVVDHEPADRDL